MKNNDMAKLCTAEWPAKERPEADRTMGGSATTGRPKMGRSETERTTEGSTTTDRPEMERSVKGRATTGRPEARVAVAESATSEAEAQRAWLEKYEPVERAIVEAHERRVESRRRNQREADEARRRATGDLMEATEGFAAVWQREGWTLAGMVAWADGDVWTLQCLARFVRLTATRRLDRLRHAARRPSYYGAENARRRARAAGRRIRRRTTLNPCPTRERILDAWLHVGESHEATIRFGSLVADLECFLDNTLIFDDGGAIVGRRGGVKRWLQENIPALYLRYTTVMRYKAAAQKLRRIAGLDDPVPAAAVVDPPSEDVAAGQPSVDASAAESSSMASSGVDAAAVEPPDAGNSDAIPAGGGQGAMDYPGVDVAGNGRVRLRCGRNDALNETSRNDGNKRQNMTPGDGTMEMGDFLGLRCGRNQLVGTFDVHDGMGGVDVCGGTGGMDEHDETGSAYSHDRAGTADVRGGTGMDERNVTGMGAYVAAIAQARAVWREVVADVSGHGPTALVARIDACALQGRPV